MSSFSIAKSKQASWREILGTAGEREGLAGRVQTRRASLGTVV